MVHVFGINEANYFSDLVQIINPGSENEVNFIEHSLCYSDQEYKTCISVQMVNYGC